MKFVIHVGLCPQTSNLNFFVDWMIVDWVNFGVMTF